MIGVRCTMLARVAGAARAKARWQLRHLRGVGAEHGEETTCLEWRGLGSTLKPNQRAFVSEGGTGQDRGHWGTPAPCELVAAAKPRVRAGSGRDSEGPGFTLQLYARFAGRVWRRRARPQEQSTVGALRRESISSRRCFPALICSSIRPTFVGGCAIALLPPPPWPPAGYPGGSLPGRGA